ncbi:hypothetical protein AB0I84_11055 [Streptomyces spectabilis]|uniref:hypothetical protein n=1 Tax=Streptomyces spectabilis TaxID=68270 RepID=UPI0033E52E22
MTTSRRGCERVDIDRLTASTITDDQLDDIRAELRHYRNMSPAWPPGTAQDATAPPGPTAEPLSAGPAKPSATAEAPQ